MEIEEFFQFKKQSFLTKLRFFLRSSKSAAALIKKNYVFFERDASLFGEVQGEFFKKKTTFFFDNLRLSKKP
jgi:hypothetical protein